MCMAMGGSPQQMPQAIAPPPPENNTLAFDKQFGAQMTAKKPGENLITRDNPLLAKSQRAALDAKNAAPAANVGLQYS